MSIDRILPPFHNDALSEAGVVSREEAFERAAYFLERAVPVAEEYKVQLACHLNDPPAPVLNGVEKWNWPVFEGLRTTDRGRWGHVRRH